MQLKSYIGYEEGYLKAVSLFNDNEFSNNDLQLMNSVLTDLGNKPAKDLVSITHRVNAPWYKASLENHVLELLLSAKITKTDFVLDMSTLIEHDERKMAIYEDFVEYF